MAPPLLAVLAVKEELRRDATPHSWQYIAPPSSPAWLLVKMLRPPVASVPIDLAGRKLRLELEAMEG